MRLTNRSDQEGEGVDVKIDDTIVLDGTNILSDTLGTGQGGHIVLQAESLRMEKNGLIQSDTFGAGRGGTIELAVGMLTLEAGAGIVSNSRRPNSGAAGAIVIHGRGGDRTAAHLVTLRTSTLQTITEGEGDGGTITVTAEAVELSGANLTAATAGAGAAGAITLNVNRLNATDQTLITSSSTATATGDAGRVAIQGVSGTGAAATVALTDSELRTETSSGLGGTVTVTADAIDLIHANLTAATTGATDAGAITLNVDHLNAADQTRITSSSTATATGNAGRVTIQGIAGAGTASRIVVLSNSAVQTQAVSDQANGGAVRVQSQLIELRDKSAISSDTTRGQRGGDIDLDATLVLLENSDIIANSVAAQEKADINISGALINNPLSVVQASGDISIFGSVFDSGSVVQLPLAFLHQAALLQLPCGRGLRGSQASSFALVGRDGLPPEPGRMLLSNLPIEENVDVQGGQRPQTRVQHRSQLSPVAWAFDCNR
jgi:large exoprotein involved in heme utilization and adhesion